SSSNRAPKATAARTTPQTTVIARETRIRCRSSSRPEAGRYRSLTIDEADEFKEPARVPIAAENTEAITSPRRPGGRYGTMKRLKARSDRSNPAPADPPPADGGNCR